MIMPKIKVTDNKGLVQETGTGVDIESKFKKSVSYDVTDLTANTTLSRGGVYTFTATATITGTLPAASTVPGSLWVFRTVTHDQSHCLTGSGLDEAPGAIGGDGKLFCMNPTGVSGTMHAGATDAQANPKTSGGELKLSASAGCAVSLMCDGFQYHALSASGTLTFVDTAAN
jgi:hypothetical protein